MKIISKERRNAINRIVKANDFGLGMHQLLIFLEERVLLKQDISLFRFDTLESPVFAYRTIKTE